MRVLVTGSSGFVGPWLTAHLAGSGDEVHELPENIDITDAGALAQGLAEVSPEGIYHLAAQSNVGRSWADPTGTFAVNAMGTLNLCQAASALPGPPRVLLISSSEVYGKVAPDELPVTERQDLAPATPYAASKAAAEMVALQAWWGRHLPVVRARAFNHTGPGQGPGFVVPDLAAQVVEAAAHGLDRIATGNLQVSRDIIDVRDVVRAYRHLLMEGRPGEAYNVCGGRPVLIADLLADLLRLAGVDVPVWTDPARARPADVPLQYGDPAKIRALCGWEPQVPLERTLSDVLATITP